ncbi:SCO family protein [Deinococcus peraridilitoris]|uniref:Uncharacterized protein SCO1/SenC/PrrC, involved in biogenesis of respiratory and photosynthetic systems n=1 Tax=Deinococcus peraridilitoris (strain DSM 19664 / LMG 22246 / CIP 109416 / KR-200) TaxID=937777 RepID=U3GKX2_DEIPD|nr:SCO family protein [Deinococcus peraridilitoris]AFZ66144.1 uncharacterized protein SCO1/SenC/PrrC, involved in biogenesis of respiratory and photosynthetic systems [Deinococcus peraridilitoris DSM 19664]
MLRLLTTLLLTVALALGGVLAYRTYLAPLGGTEVDTRPLVPDEGLVDDQGRPSRLSNLTAQTRLVFFGFTRCPDVCPATLGVLARAYEQLSEPERSNLKVVLLTVDPEHDTPRQLRDYLDRFHADFVGFSGKPAALQAMQKGFYVYAAQAGEGSFSHGDTVAVIDRAGRMRRVYTQQDLAEGLITRDLEALARGRY